MDGMPREWMRGPQWPSPEARETWEPVLVRARKAWEDLEVLSVSEGVRDSALLHLTPDELVRASLEAAGQSLEITPLAWDGTNFRAALHKPGLRSVWLIAWTGNDSRLIGGLLGFPTCCREHFAKTWDVGRTDTVLTIAQPRALECDGSSEGDVELAIDGPPEANLLLRHVGVRLVPHLPCSPTCEATVDLGRRMAEVGDRVGLDVAALYQLLDLGAVYSVNHGIAITDLEHFRFSSGTDYTPDEIVVRRGATQTRASERDSVGAHIPDAPGSTPGPATNPEANGFQDEHSMHFAHRVVLASVFQNEHGRRPGPTEHGDGHPWPEEHVAQLESALDLGAGDGALLAKIAGGRPGRWVGVEHDASRASHAVPGVTIRNWTIESWAAAELPERFDVVLLMPGRLLEMDPADAERVVRQLERSAVRLVLYCYDGKFFEFANGAGFKILGPIYRHGSYVAAEAKVRGEEPVDPEAPAEPVEANQ